MSNTFESKGPMITTGPASFFTSGGAVTASVWVQGVSKGSLQCRLYNAGSLIASCNISLAGIAIGTPISYMTLQTGGNETEGDTGNSTNEKIDWDLKESDAVAGNYHVELVAAGNLDLGTNNSGGKAFVGNGYGKTSGTVQKVL